MIRLRLLLASLLPLTLGLGGCASQSVSASISSSSPRQFIVVIDLSASRSTTMEVDAKDFMHGLIDQLSFGDQLVMLQTQQDGLKDRPKRFSKDFPLPEDPGYVSARDKSHLKATQDGFKFAVDSFFKKPSDEKIQHTDMLTTLHIASESMHDSKGAPRTTTLLLLSDMLQSAHGIEMEHLAKMPPSGWIAQQKRQGLVPALDGVCVVVFGADATNARGVKVRQFWQDYFAAAGASLSTNEYRATPPRATRNLCG